MARKLKDWVCSLSEIRMTISTLPDQLVCCSSTAFLGFRHIDPNLLSQTQRHEVSTVKAATVHYLLRVQLLGSHLDCEFFVGPQKTHILKRDTNQGRSSWQGH